MSFTVLSSLIFGVLIFGLGLLIGWSMRDSVKEDEKIRQQRIMDELERLRWKINDMIEGE